MPSPLRSDELQTVRVGHAALHQAARSFSDAGQEDLSKRALALAREASKLLEEAPEPAKTRRTPANTTSPTPDAEAK